MHVLSLHVLQLAVKLALPHAQSLLAKFTMPRLVVLPVRYVQQDTDVRNIMTLHLHRHRVHHPEYLKFVQMVTILF
jgi:hypothetical protein